jgi:diaminopimelate epimerase
LKIHFYKYQAAGNDFILIDNRNQKINLTNKQIAGLCHRRFGIGADGVILVDNDPQTNFNITYINPDGSQSLCGNGCRTAVDLATKLGMINGQQASEHGNISFNAYDGIHKAAILSDGQIKIQMNDVNDIEEIFDGYSMDTGSPHYVKFVSGLDTYPVFDEGRKMRYDKYFPKGTNANYIEVKGKNEIALRTYERGVEEETMACGTGATAAALAASKNGYASPVTIFTKGGTLTVDFKIRPGGGFYDIYLTGPAKLVYEGEVEV